MLALKRIEEDRGGIELKGVPGLGLVEALTDWTVWWLAIVECLLHTRHTSLRFGNSAYHTVIMNY